MAQFRYTAIDRTGKSVRGTMSAVSPATLADRLHSQGYMLLDARAQGSGGKLLELLNGDISPGRGLPKAQVANFTRELSVMLTAGQDIDRALRFLAENSEDKRIRRTAEALRDGVRGGKPLAAALAEHRKTFSRLYINMVRAGEAGGNLAETLEHLADLLDREIKLTATIQSALIYPCILLVVSVGTIVLLLTHVLPQFTPIFQQAGAKLPGPTRLLIDIGDAVRADGFWILAGFLFVALAAMQLLRQPRIRRAAEQVLLAIPVAGALTQRTQAARLARTLGTLLANGVSLVYALSLVRDVLSSVIATQAVEAATAEVKSGRPLAPSLAAGGVFPSQTIHLLQLGEENGRLGEMALRAAEIHETQVHQSVQRLVALLVPVITIVMGLVVAGIIGSLLVAMLSLSDLAI